MCGYQGICANEGIEFQRRNRSEWSIEPKEHRPRTVYLVGAMVIGVVVGMAVTRGI